MADGIVVLEASHRPGPCSRTNPLTPTHVDDHSLDRDDSFDPSIRLEYSPPPFCRPRDGWRRLQNREMFHAKHVERRPVIHR